MRIKNLVKIFVYSPIKVRTSGEYDTTWIYKGYEWINRQQDLDELDSNSAGDVDYEIIKLRTDKILNIEKGDGVSFEMLEVEEETKKVISGKPSYLVENKPKIGKTTLYTLITNNGE